MFTFKEGFIPMFGGDVESDDGVGNGELIEPDDKKFKKYSDLNGMFGFEKLNRPDVNAVPLGI